MGLGAFQGIDKFGASFCLVHFASKPIRTLNIHDLGGKTSLLHPHVLFLKVNILSFRRQFSNQMTITKRFLKCISQTRVSIVIS